MGNNELESAKQDFVTQWGILGNSWGVNRTMARIHALLITSDDPMATDEIMKALEVSRGNANTNLRVLVQWGLIQSVIKRGERKEYFEAEKDPWKMFRIIARERKRREIDPALEALTKCVGSTSSLKGKDARMFHRQLNSLASFVKTASGIMDRIANAENNILFSIFRRYMK